MESNLILKAGGILIKDRKIALERHGGKDIYILPGGKLEKEETMQQALVRELKEEFGINVSSGNFEEFGKFESQAIHSSDKKVEVTAFLVKSWKGEMILADGLEELTWVNSQNIERIKVSPIVKEILPLLIQRGLVD